MLTNSSQLVNKLWNFATVLRDDGVSYGDYVEQLTYLLFLKMDAENRDVADLTGYQSVIPETYQWEKLAALDGVALEVHYLETLRELGKGTGLIPTIFRKAQNRIQDPAKLKRLVSQIDAETWSSMDIDVKGEIYEGLLERNAQDTKQVRGRAVFHAAPADSGACRSHAPGLRRHDSRSGLWNGRISACAL